MIKTWKLVTGAIPTPGTRNFANSVFALSGVMPCRASQRCVRRNPTRQRTRQFVRSCPSRRALGLPAGNRWKNAHFVFDPDTPAALPNPKFCSTNHSLVSKSALACCHSPPFESCRFSVFTKFGLLCNRAIDSGSRTVRRVFVASIYKHRDLVRRPRLPAKSYRMPAILHNLLALFLSLASYLPYSPSLSLSLRLCRLLCSSGFVVGHPRQHRSGTSTAWKLPADVLVSSRHHKSTVARRLRTHRPSASNAAGLLVASCCASSSDSDTTSSAE